MPESAGLRGSARGHRGRLVDETEARRIAVRSQRLDGSATSVLETVRDPDRFGHHAAFACLASLALDISFCVWWGDWSFRFAERLRG